MKRFKLTLRTIFLVFLVILGGTLFAYFLNQSQKTQAFTLYVSNQSFAITPIDLKVFIDGNLIVNDNFNVNFQHTWIPYNLNLRQGLHVIKAETKAGESYLEKEFEVNEDNPKGVLDFWYYPPNETNATPTPRHLSFDTYSAEIGFS